MVDKVFGDYEWWLMSLRFPRYQERERKSPVGDLPASRSALVILVLVLVLVVGYTRRDNTIEEVTVARMRSSFTITLGEFLLGSINPLPLQEPCQQQETVFYPNSLEIRYSTFLTTNKGSTTRHNTTRTTI
jgi:hypothetical protein